MSSRRWASRFVRLDKLRYAMEEARPPAKLRAGDRITVFHFGMFLPAVVRRVSVLTGRVHWRAAHAPREHWYLSSDELEGQAFARGWLTSERDQLAFLAAAALERA